MPRRLRRIFAMALPRYDELTLFLMSVSFAVVMVFDAGVRETVRSMPMARFQWDLYPFYTILLLFVSGMVFSVVHVFTTRKKTGFEKTAMLYFAVIANAVAGLLAGAYLLRESQGVLAIFPLWNMFDALALLLMYWTEAVDENAVLDDNACPKAAAAGALAVAVLYLACRSLGLHWAVSFSVCVTFSANISKELHRVFPPKPKSA